MPALIPLRLQHPLYLTFADEKAKKAYKEKCSERAKDVLNDEFFGNADEIEGMIK